MEALQNRKRIALVLALVCLMLFAFVHSAQGTSPLRPSLYNTYTLQAMQWRQGKAVLEEDVPHLELAIYNGQYYVSFPPVPTVPVFLLTFLFGKNVLFLPIHFLETVQNMTSRNLLASILFYSKDEEL